MSTTSEYSFFQSVEKSFDKASKYTNWEEGLLEQIKACNSIYSMRFPVKMDDGRIEVIEAYTNDPNVGSTTTSIHAFIKDMYDNATASDPAPTYLLIVGDDGELVYRN